MTMESQLTIYSCTCVEDEPLTLAQLCRACGVPADWVIRLVEEGIIDPQGQDYPQWRFTSSHLIKVGSAHRLQRDLGINMAGIGLALELLEEVRQLRSLVRFYTGSNPQQTE